MLDAIVLIAMAVTAVAFAVGLIVQAGIPLLPGTIAAAALYLVMAASYIMLKRGSRSSAEGDRLEELEEALEIIDADLQRIDRVEDDIARLDLLADRVERLDQVVSQYSAGSDTSAFARIEDLAPEFENVHARIEALRADLESEGRRERDKIASDLGVVEDRIRQLSRELSAQAARAPREEMRSEREPAAVEPAEAVELIVEEVQAGEAAEEIVELAGEEQSRDDEMSGLVRQAVESGRVDLYLQPIVALEDRKLRYYEGLTRIRDEGDALVLPGAYLPVAERAGLMPLIDNVLLAKAVQVLRRLGPESKVKGIFCNISMRSLLDPDFFPELVEFLEENSGLSESLIFEVKQPDLVGLTRAELGCLDTLGALGYGFSLDHVADLDLDLTGLRDRYFRFLKIEAKIFLHGIEQSGAPLPAADMKAYLEEFDLRLIVEKVEEEADVARLLGHGVELAQGYLFGEPKLMGPALIRELEDADAA